MAALKTSNTIHKGSHSLQCSLFICSCIYIHTFISSGLCIPSARALRLIMDRAEWSGSYITCMLSFTLFSWSPFTWLTAISSHLLPNFKWICALPTQVHSNGNKQLTLPAHMWQLWEPEPLITNTSAVIIENESQTPPYTEFPVFSSAPGGWTES